MGHHPSIHSRKVRHSTPTEGPSVLPIPTLESSRFVPLGLWGSNDRPYQIFPRRRQVHENSLGIDLHRQAAEKQTRTSRVRSRNPWSNRRAESMPYHLNGVCMCMCMCVRKRNDQPTVPCRGAERTEEVGVLLSHPRPLDGTSHTTSWFLRYFKLSSSSTPRKQAWFTPPTQ